MSLINDDFEKIASTLVAASSASPKKDSVTPPADSLYTSYTDYLESKELPAEDESDSDDYLTGEYEQYKLFWLIDNGYTLIDFLTSVTSYANKHGRIKDLVKDPLSVIEDWEDEGGFGDHIYSYKDALYRGFFNSDDT